MPVGKEAAFVSPVADFPSTSTDFWSEEVGSGQAFFWLFAIAFFDDMFESGFVHPLFSTFTAGFVSFFADGVLLSLCPLFPILL